MVVPLLPAYGRLGTITFSPQRAVSGSAVSAQMSGLAPRSLVQLAWEGDSTGMPSGRASKDGELILVFVVPDAPEGQHEVAAVSQRSVKSSGGNRAASHFLVAGAVLLTGTFDVGAPMDATSPTTAQASATIALTTTGPTTVPSAAATPPQQDGTASPLPTSDLVTPRPTVRATPTPAPTAAPTPILVALAPPPSTPEPAPPVTSAHSVLPAGAIWADQFDGSALDPSRWGWDLAMVGTGDNMNRYAMFSTDPRLLELSGGTLKLKALRQPDGSWIQSYISTRDRYMQQYGIFRASMKIPSGHALWPAFWTLDPTRYDEMDVIEAYPEPGNPTYTFCIHSQGGTPCAGLLLPADHATAFHVYEMEWRPGTAIARIDGVEVARHAIPELRPQFLLLQMGVGVWFKDLAPDGSTPANPALEVDWVATWP